MRCRACLTLVFLLLAPLAHAEDVINVATSTYCPLACGPDKAPHDGIMHEILRRSFKGAGYRLVFHDMPYIRAVRDTLDGRYDVISYVNSAQSDNFIYVRNLEMVNELRFATLTDCPWRYRGVKSLEGIRFSIPKGFRTGNPEVDAYLDTHERDPSRIVMNTGNNSTVTQYANLECLLNDRVTAMLVGSLPFQYISQREGLTDKIRVDPEPVAKFYNRIAFSPRCPNGEALRDMVERKVRQMRTSGELESLFTHYRSNP
ncbi:hypothetical protein LF599_07770 [Pseudodesulfovibrio thermohalotolerans]|uniref:substrate-binding periplasmic protein n=1 Tax=Pseudodesulfovibrio thermohalotolerans TaxID=2880651 RepID=UPI0022B9F498|nr:transporter substrate-binding domain-containing protein [Pseudodesulfovibrio thermohalotolerans]WFS64050.1 hypothetical protein LF599_07770 [Pseudodesulfovibrio thermohalotolerans]